MEHRVSEAIWEQFLVFIRIPLLLFWGPDHLPGMMFSQRLLQTVLLLLSWACVCLRGLLLLWALLTGTMCFWASFSKCDGSYVWKLSLSQCVRAPPKSAYPRHSALMWWELFIDYLNYLWSIESYLKSIWKTLKAIWELFGSLRILQAIDHGAKQPWRNYGRPKDWLAGHIHDM